MPRSQRIYTANSRQFIAAKRRQNANHDFGTQQESFEIFARRSRNPQYVNRRILRWRNEGGGAERERNQKGDYSDVQYGGRSARYKNTQHPNYGDPKTDIEQAVGRILRDKHGDPLVIDIIDQHKPFKNQWSERRAFYNKQNYKIICTNSIDYNPDINTWNKSKKTTTIGKCLLKIQKNKLY